MKTIKLSDCAASAIEIEILDALSIGFYDGDDETAARLFCINGNTLTLPESKESREQMSRLLLDRANLHSDQYAGLIPAEMSKTKHYRISVSLGAVANRLSV